MAVFSKTSGFIFYALRDEEMLENHSKTKLIVNNSKS